MDGQRTILSEHPKKFEHNVESSIEPPLLQNHILVQVVGFSIVGHIEAI